MSNNKQEFYNISLLSIYVVLKDKKELDYYKESDKNKILTLINSKLRNSSRYQYLTNKKFILEDSYNNFEKYIVDSKVDEEKLLNFVLKNTNHLNEEIKEYILNCVIHIAYDDKKISNEEQELITQISHMLGYKTNFNYLMSNYKKSEFGDSFSTAIIIIVFIIFLVVISSIGFYFYKQGDDKDKIKIFGNETVVFSEISFNRYVIYKNTFFENKHLLKQAVFYFDGIVDIGFNPNNINYNPTTKEIIFSYTDSPFVTNTIFKNILLVDKISPEPISEEEASKFAGGLAILGAYGGFVTGAKTGILVGTLFPNLKLISPIVGSGVGSLVGGSATYFASKKILEGVKITSEITKKEEEMVKIESKNLINDIFKKEQSMLELYLNHFESFIKTKYASYGLEVKNIQYKEVK